MIFSTYDSHISQVFKDISYESQLYLSPGISTTRCTLIGHVGTNPQARRNSPATLGSESLTKSTVCRPPSNCILCAPFLREGIPWLVMWGPNPQLRRTPPAPEGFELLTKGSATLNPLYPSTWGVWTPDQGFVSNPSNQLYPMAPMVMCLLVVWWVIYPPIVLFLCRLSSGSIR